MQIMKITELHQAMLDMLFSGQKSTKVGLKPGYKALGDLKKSMLGKRVYVRRIQESMLIASNVLSCC